MKILITGDLAITKPYDSTKNLDKSVIQLFEKSDFNIVNLEAPVTDSNSKSVKTGPNLKSHKGSLSRVLKSLNINAVTLANNHLMDYGNQGVADTLAFCKEEKLAVVGGGMNLREASKILYIDSPEGKIAVINFAENEWSAATLDSAGFNPMDIIDNTRQIYEARKNAEYVFVIVHGGHEYYNLPSPRMVKQYRFYAEQGADIVVGHHTHCIGGNEVHKGVPIYYSLGNFLFPKAEKRPSDWYIGQVLEINIDDNKISHELHFVNQNKNTFNLSVEKGEDKQKILKRIGELNDVIVNEDKLIKEWNAYVSKKTKSYLSYWTPLSFINNRYFRAVVRKLNFFYVNKKGLAVYLNLIRCEAHRELSREIIEQKIKK